MILLLLQKGGTMKDIDIAKELLKKEQLSLAIIKNGEIIFTNSDFGIKPMYIAAMEFKDCLEGASVADKVIGRAAAMLLKYAEIKELHTDLISEKAFEVLESSNIKFEYEEKAEYIINRDNTGMCPVETMSLNTDNIEELLNHIAAFLKKINKL